jgi:putative hydrolase of the HAD superfamily
MAKFPKAILFDLDDTIIAAYAQPERAWEAVLAEFALGPVLQAQALAAISAEARRFWADPDRHRIWRQQILAARREIVRGAFDTLEHTDRALQDRIADRFSQYRSENLRLFPDSLVTLDALQTAGVRLALITNGAAVQQRAKIERFDLARRFHHVQIEGEHGFGKPEERAYRHALAALGAAPDEAWIVGDNLDWEVVAPARLGIFTIWFDPHGAGIPEGHPARPHRIIRALGELIADGESDTASR